ncbi:type III toxin-antitoxin system ToxN/AbiQ family toxin [Saccharibacillus sp. CPCC 101409]|uniref:type III toxin-antitoxin system ToxN/AbiQ family toxin n=1 Tax=Saccharibacillus sp. CPCC 101409 TaxID=3058041 RepID=UPI002672DD15|nr:type III toxin-antitoxin system ToxN/AbiQ family toxin [Saccharibacillus sp. CPCC 101409]MDO3411493.1 type III toxin-antitoxin system ToxN/AbiQ family toxin [Saccharibacillus sp. CPCC 101409]
MNTEKKSEDLANNTKEIESVFEEGKVKFFRMSQNYNNYLRRIDHKIEMSHKEGKSRPSVSVGIMLNGINYIIPLTSQYDSNWNNQMTFKVKELQKQSDDSYKEVVISCLKINNMHPALESELEYIDFEKQTNEKYKRLLFAEYDYIKNNIEVVTKKATQVYKKVTKSKLAVFVDNSVDFSKLESEYNKYDPSLIYEAPERS